MSTEENIKREGKQKTKLNDRKVLFRKEKWYDCRFRYAMLASPNASWNCLTMSRNRTEDGEKMIKKVMKKVLLGLISAGLCVGTAMAAPAAELDTSEEVELVMYIVSDRPAGQDAVDEHFNEMLKQKLNCTLKVNWLGWAEYSQKYPLLFSSGEKFDMAYAAGWLNFADFAKKGAFLPLDDLLPAYAPDNYALQSEDALTQATVDGHLYAVPTLLGTYGVYGAIYRGDIAEEWPEYDGNLDSWEEIGAYLEFVKENHPEMEPLDIYSGNDELLLTWAGSQGYAAVDGRYLFYNTDEEHPQVVAAYDIPGIEDFLAMTAEWNKKGFWNKSALSDTDSTKTQNGKAALRFHNVDTYANVYVTHPEWNFKYSRTTKNASHLPYTQDCMVLSTTASNPERALAFWNWITTDQEAFDAFYYGIPGVTYELNEAGQFKMLDPDLYSTSSMWAARTTQLNRSQMGTPEEYDTMRADWEEEIQPGKGAERFASFVLDTTGLETPIAGCTNAHNQYWFPMDLGFTDYTSELATYEKMMKTAGVETIIESVQRQLDDYLAAQE